MRDLTPEYLKCGGSQSSCPAVYDLDDGRLLIVGKTCGLTREELDGDGAKVGKDETAIVIDRALLANVLSK